MVYCSKCGEKIPDGAAYCPKCGNALAEAGNDRKVTKSKTLLIAVIAGAAVLFILLIIIIILLLGNAPKAEPVTAPLEQSEERQEPPDVEAAPPVRAVETIQGLAQDEADIVNEKREHSESWKREVWDVVKAEHEKITTEGRSDSYTIYIYDFKEDNTISLVFITHNSANMLGAYGKAYRYSNNKFEEIIRYPNKAPDNDLVITQTPSITPYINIDTGEVDLLSWSMRRERGLYSLNNVKWEPVFSLWENLMTAIIYYGDGDVPEEMSRGEWNVLFYDPMMANHDVYPYIAMFESGNMNSNNGRVVSWADIAQRLSAFLDEYDGINIDLAGRGDTAQTQAGATADWVDIYADFVNRLLNDKDYMHNFSISKFTITDIDFDGMPELLFTYHIHGTGGTTDTAVINPERVANFINWERNHYSGDVPHYVYMAGVPLRYFKNDRSGEIIFSALSRGVNYIKLPHFQFHRAISCGYMDEHMHILIDADFNEIEKLRPSLPIGKCGIEYGRNSPDPTVVRLVNKVLDGYTEITAPEKFSLDAGQDRSNEAYNLARFNAQKVQDWIYDVAVEMGDAPSLAASSQLAAETSWARVYHDFISSGFRVAKDCGDSSCDGFAVMKGNHGVSGIEFRNYAGYDYPVLLLGEYFPHSSGMGIIPYLINGSKVTQVSFESADGVFYDTIDAGYLWAETKLKGTLVKESAIPFASGGATFGEQEKNIQNVLSWLKAQM